MIVHDEISHIEKEGLGKTTGFRIKASGKAFKILSSGLYSRKIEAVIRELSTNAVDAHIAAGTERAFDVNLPTWLNAQFSIRDYGTGLSPEDIESIYTTYFESNKTDSNDYTGCLGLGSKSPFCYTENFTIESFFNGVKYTYAAFIDGEKMPNVSRVSAVKTDEPNGIRITIACNKYDEAQFKNDAIKVYRWFKVKPNITSHTDIVLDEPKASISGETWKFSKDYDSNYIIMGNVAYPANLPKFTGMPYKVAIWVNIGDVEITASRESLEYTERTNQYIKEKCEQIQKELVPQIQKEIDAKASYYEACCFLQENTWIFGKYSYGGKVIVRKFTITDGRDRNKLLKDNKDYQDSYSIQSALKRYGLKNPKYSYEEDFYYQENNKYFFDDLKSGGRLRVSQYIKNKPLTKDTYIFISGNYKNFLDDSSVPKEKIIKTSTLDKVIVTSSGKPRIRGKILIYRHNDSRGGFHANLTPIDYEDTMKGVYLNSNMYELEDGFHLYQLKNYQMALDKLGFDSTIYVAPKSLKLNSKNTKLVHLSERVPEIKKKYEEKKDLIDNIDNYERYETLPKIIIGSKDKELDQFIKNIQDVNKHKNLYYTMRNLFAGGGSTQNKKTPIDKYPLLKMAFSYGSWDKVIKEEVAEYVKLKESQYE